MEKLFTSLRELDRRAESLFNMGNGLLMENAARGMAEKIRTNYAGITRCDTVPLVQIICGSGDNGGDGMALARFLADWCTVRVAAVKEPKSPLCKLQRDRLHRLNIPVYNTIDIHCDILVDALFGTGLHGMLDTAMTELITQMNAADAYKIACDIPSGLDGNGVPRPIAFRADETHSMGGLKTALYADAAKDYTGYISVINLGIPRSCYEQDTDTFLLSEGDMQLPHRRRQNTHKMDYGHALFFCGEKSGACFLAASAALTFGAGLVSICGTQPAYIPPDFMYAAAIPRRISAFAAGSGLGKSETAAAQVFNLLDSTALQQIPVILDADILHRPELPLLLPHFPAAILTPHPKEFQSLLLNTDIADISVQEIQENRFLYARRFCRRFPHVVLVLKGAYPIIGQGERLYVNPLGTNALAKAGTGDVLAGMITALAAQQYQPLQAAITASLAHAIAARQNNCAYSLTASSLISALRLL